MRHIGNLVGTIAVFFVIWALGTWVNWVTEKPKPTPTTAYCFSRGIEDHDPRYRTYEPTIDGYEIPPGFFGGPCKLFKREANV